MATPLCRVEEALQGYSLFAMLLRIALVSLLYITLSYINTSIIWDILFSKSNNERNIKNNTIFLDKLYNVMYRILINISIVMIVMMLFNIRILVLYLYVNIIYLIAKMVYKSYLKKNKIHINVIESFKYMTKIDLYVMTLSLIVLIYTLLPVVHKQYLIGDIRLHFMIIDGVFVQGRIEPYLSKYDAMLTYSPGLHASYAFLTYVTRGFANLLCFPLLIYGIYYLFTVALMLTLYLYTRSLLQTTLATIVAMVVLPPAVGFHFFPAVHIFVFSFAVLVLLQLHRNNIFTSVVIAVLMLLIHPVSGFALLIISLLIVLIKGVKRFMYEVSKYKLQTIYIILLLVILLFHFVNVFHNTDRLVYFTKPAAYSKVLNRNKQILYSIMHSGFDLFNYPWYVRVDNLYLSQIFIMLSIAYIIFSKLSKKYNIKVVIALRNDLFKVVCLWHIVTYILLLLAVDLNVYYLMPTSFNRMISFSVLFVLILVWTVRIATRKRYSRILFYVALLLSILGADVLLAPHIANAYKTYAKRTESFIYTINVKAFNDIVSIIGNDSDATIIIQVNAPSSVMMPLFEAKRIVVLQDGIRKNILELPKLILEDPRSAYQIMVENNIDYYIMYFPSKYDSWIIKYASKILYGDISNPYKLYIDNRSVIEKYFVIVYEKYNYVVLTPLHRHFS